jgi:hypothetical protein
MMRFDREKIIFEEDGREIALFTESNSSFESAVLNCQDDEDFFFDKLQEMSDAAQKHNDDLAEAINGGKRGIITTLEEAKCCNRNKGDEWIEIEDKSGAITLLNIKKVSIIEKNPADTSISIIVGEVNAFGNYTVKTDDPSYPAIYKRFFGEGEAVTNNTIGDDSEEHF